MPDANGGNHGAPINESRALATPQSAASFILRMSLAGPKETWCRRLPMSGFEAKADAQRCPQMPHFAGPVLAGRRVVVHRRFY